MNLLQLLLVSQYFDVIFIICQLGLVIQTKQILWFVDQDLLGYHAMFSDNLATLPATHSCPFMSYTRVPQRPSFTNGHSVEMHSDGRGYRHQWSHFSRPRESQSLHTMTPSDLHYRGWEHHQAYSLLNEHINSAGPAGHSSRHEADGSPAAGSAFHPFTLSRGLVMVFYVLKFFCFQF